MRWVSHVRLQCTTSKRTIAWHIYRFMLNKQHMKSTFVAAGAAAAAVIVLGSTVVCMSRAEPQDCLSQHWFGFYLCAFLQASQ